ncbi:MAG: hypothetical protein RLZ98_3287 [Pseudomonadota bacterium]|jgi:hypothetical protein
MPSTVEPEGWRELLADMTEEELVRYGEIAGDQIRLEWQQGWLQVLAAVAALGLSAVGLWLMLAGGMPVVGAAMVGLAVALGYWPYSKAKMRRMWGGHVEAVEAELSGRRATKAELQR